MKKLDMTSGLFWLLVGAGFASGGFYYGFGTWKHPGPGMLPAVFGIILGVLSISLFAMSLKVSSAGADLTQIAGKKGVQRRIILTLLALVGFLLSLNQAGFLLTTFVFVLFLLKFVGRKRWITSILSAFLFSFICYALFSLLLGTPLPPGQIYGSYIGVTARV